MKQLKKLAIILSFAIPTIALNTAWNLQANNEKELILGVAIAMFFITWSIVNVINEALKSIK